jgi:hypothetical protein
VRPSVDIFNAAEDGCHSVISFRPCSRLAKFIWMIDQFIFNEPQNDSERYQCTAFRALNSDRSLSASHSPASQPCFIALLHSPAYADIRSIVILILLPLSLSPAPIARLTYIS